MDQSLRNVLGAEALAGFDNPGPVARGLPPSAYTSEAFLELEKATLFRNAWVFVGFAHELRQPGDAVPVTVAGQPVLLVCNKEEKIKAFYNVCRHRCLKLVDTACNVGRVLRCPYHSWTYSLDGALKITPYFGGKEPRDIPEGFDRGARGLLPIRCGVWQDWVFVNLSGDAPEFEDFVAPLDKWMADIEFSTLTHLTTIELGEVKTNWKLLMENFIEPYHVQFVHVSTTQQPLTDHYTVNDAGCLGSAVDISRESGEAVREDTLSVSSRYLTLFPNFVLGRYYPDQIGVHLNVPLAANRTYQRRAIYATSPDAAAATQTEKLAKLWTAVHREDHAMCERLQVGRESDAASDGGVLSPVWETSVLEFQRLVVASLR